MILLDFRCPECDQVIDGGPTDIRTVRKVPTRLPKKCRNCNVDLALVSEPQEFACDTACYYFSTATVKN
jgi:hypothetical protein